MTNNQSPKRTQRLLKVNSSSPTNIKIYADSAWHDLYNDRSESENKIQANMKDQKYIIIVCSVFAAIAVILFINARLFNHDTQIEISENKHSLELSASFPDEVSKKVHDYLQSQLRMTDLSDLTSVEIKHYETPDYKMRFYIKSRNGYIKIVLDKDENTLAAYHRLKKTSEGLKNILN